MTVQIIAFVTHKICTKCKIEKPSSEFYKDKIKKDGLYSHCKECHYENTEKYRKANREKFNKVSADYRKRNIEKIRVRNNLANRVRYSSDPKYREDKKKRSSDYHHKNRDAALSKQKANREANRERNHLAMKRWYLINSELVKAKTKAYSYQHRERMKPIHCAKTRRRQAAKINATPAWANHEAIKEIYVQCAFASKSTGIKHNVDHIIPLQSKFVCGLHVENNLQIIPAKHNQSKGNSYADDATPKEMRNFARDALSD